MFEAYKVGITVALTNQISRGLMLIQRDLLKTDAHAIRLKATLSGIEKLAIGGAVLGGAGYAGLRVLEKGYEAAKQYEQAFARFKSLNLGDAVNQDANRFARGANIIGASATDLMQTTRDLTTVLGNYGLARQLAPGFAQLKYANQAVYGGHGLDFNEGQLQALEKIIEMKGGYKSASDFLGQANMMQQIVAGTGGMVKPSDYLAFIKTAGVSGRLLSNDAFYYQMEPLIQEMGGNRVGTGMMSAYNNLGQGRATVRAAQEMMRLGIVDPSMVEFTKIGTVKRVKPGALKGMDEFTSSPYQWMKDILIPAMAAKGITSKDGILNEMGALLGNRTGSNLFSLMYLQQDKIEKNMGISKNAMGVNDLVKLARSSPAGAEEALGKAWENLKIAAGEALIPIVIPALNALAGAFRELGKHPTVIKTVMYGFAALAATLAVSGIGLTLGAAFRAIGLIGSFTSGLAGLTAIVGQSAIPAVAGLAAALWPVVAAAAAIYAVTHPGQVGKFTDAVGGSSLNPLNWAQGAGDAIGHWMAPSGNKTIQVNTAVKLDGRTVAQAVTHHQAYDMNRDLASGSGFDGRLSFTAPAMP